MNLSDLQPRPGCHAIVVGGGPSAPSYYSRIDTQSVVIAPSTMLIPLQAAGIFPDYTCAIDPSSVMALHFKNVDTTNALVFSPGIVRRCWQDWNGPLYRVWDLPGSSVLHLAVDVAIRLKPRSITLIGADFCFPNGKSHADGVTTAYAVSKSAPKVANAKGDMVATESSLLHYRGELEAMVAAHPEILWRRVGREGLTVAGCEVIE